MEEEVVDILRSVGAVRTDGHFVGTSGRHMSVYVNKDALLARPIAAGRIGELFAEKNKHLAIDVVVAPAMGAVILGHWTAYHLSCMTGKEVLSAYTEKDAHKNQVFKRNYETAVAGKHILVIEDTTATGGSLQKTVATVTAGGGIVMQACAMINRDPDLITSELIGAPYSWLASIPATTYEPGECLMCAQGIPLSTDIGHGHVAIQ